LKIITVSNRKGGVGKTTTAYNLGHTYAKDGKRVLFVDLDEQGNLTTLNRQDTISLEEWKRAKPVVVSEGISLLRATGAFPQLTDEINREIDRNSFLKRLLAPVVASYDVVVIDTPPSLGIININAYCLSHVVLVVVNPDSFSLNGLAQMRKVLKEVKSINHGLQYRIILNAYFTGRRLTGDALEVLQDEPGYLNIEIPHRQSIVTANADREPAILHDEIYQSFKKLSEAVL